MHEFSLYGQVAEADHDHLLQQLAGVARMQPIPVEELHLVFKAQAPPGLGNVPSSGEASTKQDVQRVAKMLSANLYYVRVIGELQPVARKGLKGDASMSNGNETASDERSMAWQFEFKDTPDPGKQAVNGRLTSRTPIEDGDIMKFMKQFGYDYEKRYMVKGSRLYDQDTTLSLHRLYRVPEAKEGTALDWTFIDKPDAIRLFDISGGYILQVSVDAVDGGTSELKDAAAAQLVAMRELLKPVVALAPVDRLSLDTRAIVRR